MLCSYTSLLTLPLICFSKFNEEEKNKTIDILNTMGSEEKHDTYLCALITVNTIVRRRPKTGDGPTRFCSCKFKIRINIREVNVCKKAFSSLLGIGKSRVDRLNK